MKKEITGNTASLIKAWKEMQSRQDLLDLLNNISQALYGEKAKPIQMRSLQYHAQPGLSKNRYNSFAINKKNGGKRIIHSPGKGLKSILNCLNHLLQAVFEINPASNGFVQGKSIVDNARLHIGNHYVYNLDLKDFFHSFDRNRVKMGLMFSPKGLGKEREQLAFFISCLMTHPMEVEGEVNIVLPQGSPASPVMTNILCLKLDRRLTGLANRFGAQYSRYADDITFSSGINIFNKSDFLNELKRIVEDDQGFQINKAKVRLQKDGYRQEVTGLTVNEKVNVKPRFVKQIRMWLYYWEKYGFEKAEDIFRKDYLRDKSHLNPGKPNIINVLDGKINYLGMVRGHDDPQVLALKNRFSKLLDKTAGLPALESVLDVWEKEGIEKAMELFNLNNNENDESKH